MSFVADASVTLPWCFEDEATSWTEGLLSRVGSGESIVVPAHWATEVINGLLTAVRRNRITRNKAQEFIEDLRDLPIEMDHSLEVASWTSLLELAHQ